MTRTAARRPAGRPLALAAACLIAADIWSAALARADEDPAASVVEPAASAKPSARMLFSGTDVSGDINLWFTDGTAAGTVELTHVGFGGIQPVDITPFGTGALFRGLDIGTGTLKIWTTDGTSKGTHKLKIAGTPPANISNGLSPNITSIGSKALFPNSRSTSTRQRFG